MKTKTLFLSLLMLVAITASAQVQQKKVERETYEWRYELQAAVGQGSAGSVLVKVYTYSKKPQLATAQAGKNAVHGVMFKGYPDLNDGSHHIVGRAPMIANPSIEEEKADYFAEFFKDGGAYQRYISFIGNGVPDAPIKVGKEYKIGITVVVLYEQLRKRLEEDGILSKTSDVIEGKLPIVMVVPSDVWCNKNKYTTTFNNQGKTEYIVDYEKALMNNQELSVALNTVNTLLANRGFDVKKLDACLKSLKNDAAEQSVTTSKNGAELAESPVDVLHRVAKADIWISVDWFTTDIKGGSNKTLTFTMQAYDAYTDMAIGGSLPSTSHPVISSQFQLPVMIEDAVQANFSVFCDNMIQHFADIQKNGRAIKLNILTWEDFEDGVFAEYDGDELVDIIEDWLADNTINGKYGSPDIPSSGNRMTVEQVRIPLKNKKGRDLDARSWARDLQKQLQQLGIESNLSTKGLGNVQLILGGK